jgi:hypothetical protein
VSWTFLHFALIAILPALAEARPTAVNIGVYDKVAMEKPALQSVSAYLRANLPDTKVVEALTQGPFTDDEAEKNAATPGIQSELIKQLSEKLEPGDVITHLVITAHSDTIVEPTHTYLKLRYMGRVFEDGVNDDFKRLFGPLKGRMAPNATIVFNACHSLCGDLESAKRRAKSIATYLGVSDGAIYGAETYEMIPSGAMDKQYRLREFIPSRHFVERMLPIGVGVALAQLGIHYFQGSPDAAMDAIKTLPAALAAFEGLHVGLRMVAPRVASVMGYLNRGRIFSFSSGEVTDVKPTRKMLSLKEVYGVPGKTIRTCRSLF